MKKDRSDYRCLPTHVLAKEAHAYPASQIDWRELAIVLSERLESKQAQLDGGRDTYEG